MSEHIAGDIRVYRADELISYRDDSVVSDTQLHEEMQRVYEATEVERQWLREHPIFKTDHDILNAVVAGELVKVRPTLGIMPIQRLVDYDQSRQDAQHPFHYSPPYLKPGAWQTAEFIGRAWSLIQREQRNEPFIFIPLTSAIRSASYQEQLTMAQERKIAIDATGEDDSSHEYGWAFDLDAGGLYRYDPIQRHVQAINPRQPGFDQDAELIAISRDDLRGVLQYLKENEVINFVEEVPGTKEWCFHVCVNPNVNSGSSM